jgi:hypothetical protein
MVEAYADRLGVERGGGPERRHLTPVHRATLKPPRDAHQSASSDRHIDQHLGGE